MEFLGPIAAARISGFNFITTSQLQDSLILGSEILRVSVACFESRRKETHCQSRLHSERRRSAQNTRIHRNHEPDRDCDADDEG
jgi:hypothetical protein